MAKSSNEIVYTEIHTGERPFKCGISNTQPNCNSITIMQHSDEKNFSCDICNKEYANRKALTLHLLKHNATSMFQCNICQKHLSRKSNLNSHLKIHSGDRPFECEICNKTYIHKSSWLAHLKSHNCKKAFECNKCNKKFLHSYELKIHLLKHDDIPGGKPFVCNICKKRLTSKTSLGDHLRLHTGETPFKCEFCGKLYAIKRSLNKHIIRVHRFESSTRIRDKRIENDESIKMNGTLDGIQIENNDICIGNFDRRLITKELKVYLGEKIILSGNDSKNKKIERERLCTRPPRVHLSKKSSSSDHCKPFECKKCGKKVTTKSNLTNHIKVHTREKTTNSKIRSVNTKENRLATPCTEQQLGEDMLTSISVDAVENCLIPDEMGDIPLLKVQSSQRFGSTHHTLHDDDNSIVCDVCSRKFDRKSSLSNHIKVHIKKNPIQKIKRRRRSIPAPTLKMFDEESESGPKNSSKINPHIEKLTEQYKEKMKNRNNSQCLRMPSSKRMNPLNISPSADIMCNVCDRHFNRKSSLSNHIKVHSRETAIKKTTKKDSFPTRTSKMPPSRKLNLANVHNRLSLESNMYPEKSKKYSGLNLPPKIQISKEQKPNSTNNYTKKFKEYCPSTAPPRIINTTEEQKSKPIGNRDIIPITNSVRNNVPTKKFKEYCPSTAPPRIINTTEEQKSKPIDNRSNIPITNSVRNNVTTKKFKEYCLTTAPPRIMNTTEEKKLKPIDNRDNIPSRNSVRNDVLTKKFKEYCPSTAPPRIINSTEEQKSKLIGNGVNIPITNKPIENRDNIPLRNFLRNNVPTKKFKEYCLSTAPPRIIKTTEEKKLKPFDNRDNVPIRNSVRNDVLTKKFKEYCPLTAPPRIINTTEEKKSNPTDDRVNRPVRNPVNNNVPTKKLKEYCLPTDLSRINTRGNVNITNSLKNNVSTEKFREYSLSTSPSRVQTSEHTFESIIPSIKIEDDHFLIERSRVPSAEVSFACFTCHGKFDAEIDLIRHLRLHTSEKPSEPNILFDQIKEEYSNQHSTDGEEGEEKPFKCYTCHKTFDQQISLTLHLRSHISGEAILFGVPDIKIEANSDLSVHNASEFLDNQGGSLASAGAYCITDIIKDECPIEIEYNELI